MTKLTTDELDRLDKVARNHDAATKAWAARPWTSEQEKHAYSADLDACTSAYRRELQAPTALALVAEVKRLREALEPFAKADIDDACPNTRPLTGALHDGTRDDVPTLGDVRRARAALSPAQEGG